MHSPTKYLGATFFKSFVYPISKRGRLVTCNTFFETPMQLILPSASDIYILGGKGHDSEVRLAKYMVRSLQPNDTFIDVGAHFGYFSLFASKIIGTEGRVISIEASKEVYQILSKNVSNFKNITAYHLACSDKDETLEFYEFPILYSEYNTISIKQFENTNWLASNAPNKINVTAKMIDTLVKELAIQPNFIKIDVEGAEYNVVKGMIDSLHKKSIHSIAMEFLSNDRQNKIHIDATNFLIANNYVPHVIDEEGNLTKIDANLIPKYLKDHELESDNIIFRYY